MKREENSETHQNIRSCGHVDDGVSALLTPRTAVPVWLGTGLPLSPDRSRRRAAGRVVHRPSTRHPQLIPRPARRPTLTSSCSPAASYRVVLTGCTRQLAPSAARVVRTLDVLRSV